MEKDHPPISMAEIGRQMEFLRLFKLLNCTLRENVDRHIRELDLTASQLDVLICIAQHGAEPVNQKDIEEELRLSNPTVTGILKRLERKGFITRTVGTRDRRYKEVRLTSKCLQLAEKLHPSGHFLLQKAFRGFTPEEFDTLNRMLTRLLENCIGLDDTSSVRAAAECWNHGEGCCFSSQAVPACPSSIAR